MTQDNVATIANANSERTVWALTVAQLEQIAGRKLTSEEITLIEKCLDHSELPDIVKDVVASVTGTVAEEDQENDDL